MVQETVLSLFEMDNLIFLGIDKATTQQRPKITKEERWAHLSCPQDTLTDSVQEMVKLNMRMTNENSMFNMARPISELSPILGKRFKQ